MPSTPPRSFPPSHLSRVLVGVASGLILLTAGCGDTATAPGHAPLAAAKGASRDVLDSPSSSSVELVVPYQAPLAGDVQIVGSYAYPTVVAMDVHQQIGITMLPPFPPGTGQLGLAGRVSDFGCTHQGEAYLISSSEAGVSYFFAGCQLASDRTLTTFSDTVEVNGTLKYGYSFDSACPYPSENCGAYSGSSGIRLARIPAKLEITADTLHDGELWAWPGFEYTVAAAPKPAQMGRYATPVLPTGNGWSFKPDSGVEQPDFCLDGSGRTCDVTFTKSGSLTLTAIVNGEAMVSAPLRVQTPAVAVALSDTSVSVGDTLLITTSLRGADASILTGYYAGYTGTQTNLPGGGASHASTSDGLPPCLTTQPIPLHCYIVMTAPGRALVGVSAKIGRTYFGDYKYVTVKSAPRASVVIVPEKTGMMTFSRNIPGPTCAEDFTKVTQKLHVIVIDSGAATPTKLPNRLIKLALAAVVPLDPSTPDAGGHVIGAHATAEKPAGSLSATEITTDANGDAYVTYTASEFSGKYEVRAESEAATPGADTITVGIPLQPLSPGQHYSFIGETTAHPSNHFATPTMNARLVKLADQFFDQFDVGLEYNDESLPLGGRFEVAPHASEIPRWTNISHCDHRWGRGADLRTNTFQQGYTRTKLSPEVQSIITKWIRLSHDMAPADS